MALLLFLAINHVHDVRAFVSTQETTAASTNGPIFSSGSKLNPQPFLQRRSSLVLNSSPNSQVDEEVDDAFFLKASQQASQFRMQQLKDGQDPLAISIASSSPDDISEVVVEAESKQADEGDIKVPTSLDEDTAQVETKSLQDEKLVDESVAVPVAGELPKEEMTAEEAEQVRNANLSGTRGEGSTPAEKDVATTAKAAHITEGQTAEEAEEVRKARLNVADEAAKILEQPPANVEEGEDTTDSGVASTETNEDDTDDELQKQQLLRELSEVKFPAEPFKDPKRLQQQKEEIAEEETPDAVETADIKPDTSSTEDTATKTAANYEESSESKPAPTSDEPKLSSDGKALFEPSQTNSTSSEVNQENIDMGLIVLTRGLLTLKSIVDRNQDHDKQ